MVESNVVVMSVVDVVVATVVDGDETSPVGSRDTSVVVVLVTS